jgi:hypothetical protein
MTLRTPRQQNATATPGPGAAVAFIRLKRILATTGEDALEKAPNTTFDGKEPRGIIDSGARP